MLRVPAGEYIVYWRGHWVGTLATVQMARMGRTVFQIEDNKVYFSSYLEPVRRELSIVGIYDLQPDVDLEGLLTFPWWYRYGSSSNMLFSEVVPDGEISIENAEYPSAFDERFVGINAGGYYLASRHSGWVTRDAWDDPVAYELVEPGRMYYFFDGDWLDRRIVWVDPEIAPVSGEGWNE